MFKETICVTPFTEGDVESRVNGDRPWGDSTFLATLRALLEDKLEEKGEGVYFQMFTTRGRQAGDVVYSMYALNGADGTISLCNINGGKATAREGAEYIRKFLEECKQNGNEEQDGWEEVPKVNAFFKKAFEVYCFINKDRRCVMLVTDEISEKKYHYLQCAIPVILPWYFPKEVGLKESEMALIKSLMDTKPSAYIDAINRIAVETNLAEKRIKRLLDGFELAAESDRREELKQQLLDCMRKIDDYKEEIGRILERKSRYDMELIGLDMKLANGEGSGELMEYFLCNKKLSLKYRNGNTIGFSVTGYLTYINEEQAETYINNKNSYIYPRNTGNITHKGMELLMRAIFLDNVLRVRVCAGYELTVNRGVAARTGFDFGPEGLTATPNPHINDYRCLGNYSKILVDLIAEHNYVVAIEQCVASCQSLNFGDACVMETFMRVMYGTCDSYINRRCIELPDGNVVLPEEALVWLKDNGYAEE